ncbi:mitochondrial ribosomal protein S22 [Babesia ovis]|uniref:Mitochondrial ribosomal protein S22 n=1 Tax=Babesia ovis TaxID=5869 RepID=A0A9W5T990_BABOV|nr:mitochondrial ribosomal protein S22 [Babesia ovis]
MKAAGKKKDIDACGSYISKRLAARRCVEVPRVLPSTLLDTDSTDTEHVDALKKLANDPNFAHLKELLQQNKLGTNEQAQTELAEAEDARHKIVPKNSPEGSGYRYARDAMWGDLWRFPYRVQQPIARGYTPDKVKKRMINSEELQTNIHEALNDTDAKIKEKVERDIVRHYGG